MADKNDRTYNDYAIEIHEKNSAIEDLNDELKFHFEGLETSIEGEYKHGYRHKGFFNVSFMSKFFKSKGADPLKTVHEFNTELAKKKIKQTYMEISSVDFSKFSKCHELHKMET